MTTCLKCDQEVVPEGHWFWVLPSEAGTGRATFCPVDNRSHEVDDDDEAVLARYREARGR